MKCRTISYVKVERQIHKFKLFFTSGCFDLFHPGHIYFFDRCLKELANGNGRLVVGLNSDKSIWKWKDHDPIQLEADRAQMIGLHPAVDYITAFDEATPKRLIEELQPNVILHGHSKERPAWGPESESELEGFQGEVVRIPIKGEWSTTNLISRACEIGGIANAIDT